LIYPKAQHQIRKYAVFEEIVVHANPLPFKKGKENLDPYQTNVSREETRRYRGHVTIVQLSEQLYRGQEFQVQAAIPG